MVGFEKALGAVKKIKDQIQYRSQSLLNSSRGYFSRTEGWTISEEPNEKKNTKITDTKVPFELASTRLSPLIGKISTLHAS